MLSDVCICLFSARSLHYEGRAVLSVHLLLVEAHSLYLDGIAMINSVSEPLLVLVLAHLISSLVIDARFIHCYI